MPYLRFFLPSLSVPFDRLSSDALSAVQFRVLVQ